MFKTYIKEFNKKTIKTISSPASKHCLLHMLLSCMCFKLIGRVYGVKVNQSIKQTIKIQLGH